jgi:manganese/zinc/iron transport system substrate-binding protein
MWAFFFLYICSACTPDADNISRSDSLKNWKESNGKLKVLSTIAMIGDLVQYIGDGYVDTWTLIQGELDPHTYQLVKGDDEKLGFADIIFFNGLGLEHGPSLQRYLHQQEKAISIGGYIREYYSKRLLYAEGQIDPHIWMDISLWMEAIPLIVKTLSAMDPSHAQVYLDNGNALYKEMENTHLKIREQLLTIPPSKRYLVTSHDAFNYFARAYLATEEEQQLHTWQSRFAAPEGLSPESQLSATDIQVLLKHLERYKIQLLFTESNVSQDSIKKILTSGREKGLSLKIIGTPLYGDSIGPTGNSYLQMIRHNASTIENSLKNHHE